MPPPRKVDLLPPDLRDWLKEACETRGWSGYEELADTLNRRLVAEGSSLRIQKTAVAAFGKEHRQFVKLQEEASAWAKDWMTGQGLGDEAEQHKVLFQMINTLAFKVMKAMLKEGEEPDPKDLHFLGKMMKDVMSSSGIRDKLIADAETRAAKEAVAAERKAQGERLDMAVVAGDLEADAVRKAKELMGFG